MQEIKSKNWTSSALLETDGGDASVSSVAINSSGTAVVAWAQDNDGLEDVKVARYNETSGWITVTLNPAETETKNTDRNIKYLMRPHTVVAQNESGDAIVAWTSALAGERLKSIAVSVFNVETEMWGASTVISRDTSYVYYAPDLKVNANGDAVLIWAQGEGVDGSLYSVQYSADSKSWSEPELLANGLLASPQLVLSDDGEFTVLFSLADQESNLKSLYSITRNLDGTLTDKQPLDLLDGNISEFSVAVSDSDSDSDSDTIIVTWCQQRGSDVDAWAAIRVGGEWQVPERVNTESGHASAPVADFIGDTGGIVMLWAKTAHEGSSSYSRHLYQSIYTTVTGWSENKQVQYGSAHVPSLSSMSEGFVLGAWSDATVKIFNDGEWSSDGFNPGQYIKGAIKIATAKNGRAIATWIATADGDSARNLKWSMRK